MTRYCTAPNCKNDSGNTTSDRKSFYKFPLHDPERLQLWLKNMGRDGWTPSCHQYLCHEHFLPSCFTLRWGIRYLASDAVPTVFDLSESTEKRKGADHFERRAKRQRHCGQKSKVNQSDKVIPDSNYTAFMSEASSVQLYAITMDSSSSGEPLILDASDTGNMVNTLERAVPLPNDLQGPDGDPPLTLFHTTEGMDLTDCEGYEEVVMMLDSLSPEGEAKGDPIETTGTESQMLQDPSYLITENEAVKDEMVQEDDSTQLVAYFEAIPNVLSSSSAIQASGTPDTVLCSSLSSKPIVSTVPIISKHMSPSPDSLVLTLEKLTSVTETGDDGVEDDHTEDQSKPLEEHRYHKNSLSKEQLEAIVMELQKKVKILQQRHRRHLDKLHGLESTVCQLRISNLLKEERLQLLERAYLHTTAALSDAGETVTIIYEDNTTCLCAEAKTDEE